MTNVLLQFYALPHEICEELRAFVEGSDIALVEYRFPPKFVRRINIDDIFMDKDRYQSGGYWLFLILKSSPLYSLVELPKDIDFMPDVGGYMRCVIGKSENNVLHESFVSSASDDLSELKIWRKFSRRITQLCPTGGAYMIGEESGKRYEYKNMRASLQARELSKKCGKLLNLSEKDVFYD